MIEKNIFFGLPDLATFISFCKAIASFAHTIQFTALGCSNPQPLSCESSALSTNHGSGIIFRMLQVFSFDAKGNWV